MTPVIDAVMDGEGMGVLHPAIQEMMLGAKTPQQVATEYEKWVAANDTSRK
jgi:raffinose/stachyose/melibiose transport system substrate-binding protein